MRRHIPDAHVWMLRLRMIPFGDDWAEPLTTMAFPPSIMFKLWLPGEPMPDDLVDEVVARLRP